MSLKKKHKKNTAGRPRRKSPTIQRASFDLGQALANAIKNHQAGNLQQAEEIYEKILAIHPNHAETLHAKAIMSCQRGQHAVAVSLFQKAIYENPAKAAYHYNLGNALKDLGRFDEAAPSYRKALLLQPDYLEALNNLGVIFHHQARYEEALSTYQKALQLQPNHADTLYNLANTLQSQGRLQEALLSYKKALAIKEDFLEVYAQLGNIFCDQGKPDAAIGCFQHALQLNPTAADGHFNLARALKERGSLDEAIVCYQRALKLQPTSAIAYNNLGNIFQEQGRFTEADACLRRALELRPDYPEAHNNLATIQLAQGQLTESESSCRRALELLPNCAEIYGNLGNTLKAQGRIAEAITSYQQALLLKPTSASAYNNLGNLLQKQGRLAEAEACLRRALEINPDYIEAHSNIGNVLKDQGLLDEAVASYRQALLLKPDYASAHSNLLLTIQYLNTFTPMEIFNEHQRYAEHFEAPLRCDWQPHQNSPDPERRLRVGYVSGDFCNHAVAFFIEPILASHDKSQVEIYCYYNNTKRDGHTERMTANADHWLVCMGMNDEELTRQIRSDGIDILIDLSGHTAHNRLPVFAKKPAPVQATWIGYAGTTGLTAMDYRITDAYMDPPGLTERYHTEKLIRLPDTVAAYRPEPGCPQVNPLPALKSDELIFASLNNPTKINPGVTALWARLLTALPHARLMLGNAAEGGIQQRLIELFGAAGIAAERLILQPRMPIVDYLALHHHIDLALDPFPYNGGTTTYHSLWMGVPVITLAGEQMVSRCGVAILSRIGMHEFITHSEEEYLQRAIELAQDLPGLNRIRQSLREQMSGTNCKPGNITHHLEAAYRDMWRRWCKGERQGE
ncbi:MAG: tetratricopeptide repeat protein [Proteobacteria bacterium]|nr:tetratricopeptide repeat protein [Pseudomonadota bacterium]